MRIVTTIAELDPCFGGVFVPTMGALHAGHFALVREAKRLSGGRPVVVSIFVNPTQFNDPKDLARYPRTLDADAAGCAEAGADVVFAPAAVAMYPPDSSVAVPRLPEVATRPGLEDAHRPGHFAGVCQVVKRLFEVVRPAAAVFGEKDWQQLQVIRAMVAQEHLGIAIEALPTVREEDGLAMSSRNVFLSSEDRCRALAISRALCEAAGKKSVTEAERVMATMLREANLGVEYAVVREASTLMPLGTSATTPARALIAARCGSVRLIDNAPWPRG